MTNSAPCRGRFGQRPSTKKVHTIEGLVARGNAGATPLREPQPATDRALTLTEGVVTLTARPAETAVVVIDLMPRIVHNRTHPHSGTAVLERTAQLVQGARRAGLTVVLVRTERPEVDAQPPGSGLCDAMAPQAGDIEVVKNAWGAFQGTPLEAMLASAGVTSLWICGIATNHGVESTARVASDIGYDVVLVEDCMSGLEPGQHEFAVDLIFPKLGTVATSNALLRALTTERPGQ